ncbi:MAG: murein hydrolase activator EnvC family protein [Leptospirales bacterium]
MNKEKLHVRLEQSHLQEIHFSRDLEKLNRSIRRERLSLKSHRRTAASLQEELISQSLRNYLFQSDGSPGTQMDVIGLFLSEQAYIHVRKKIASDRFIEASTSVKMSDLSRQRRKMIRVEMLRRSEEAQEEAEMRSIRAEIIEIQSREKGLEKKNKVIYTKTRHLLGLIHHLEIVNKHRLVNRRSFLPVHLRLKGLEWPVRGKIVESFGKFHDGIDIQAPDGTSVMSAESGRVLFARHYAGYGKLVIINHGRHVYSLYGHLKSIDVREGVYVHKGERLGIAGGGGTNGRSTLFFGLTHRGNPVNPVPYLNH